MKTTAFYATGLLLLVAMSVIAGPDAKKPSGNSDCASDLVAAEKTIRALRRELKKTERERDEVKEEMDSVSQQRDRIRKQYEEHCSECPKCQEDRNGRMAEWAAKQNGDLVVGMTLDEAKKVIRGKYGPRGNAPTLDRKTPDGEEWSWIVYDQNPNGSGKWMIIGYFDKSGRLTHWSRNQV